MSHWSVECVFLKLQSECTLLQLLHLLRFCHYHPNTQQNSVVVFACVFPHRVYAPKYDATSVCIFIMCALAFYSSWHFGQLGNIEVSAVEMREMLHVCSILCLSSKGFAHSESLWYSHKTILFQTILASDIIQSEIKNNRRKLQW